MIKWLEDAVFYEVYPQSFRDSNGDGIGDIPGITEKLEYIQELGCNALWINPCFTGWLTVATAAALGALPSPASLLNKPRLMP